MEFKNGNYNFRIPNISPHIFEVVLRYLYCGQMDLSSKDGPDILKLLVAADELGLNTLCEYIQEYLNEHQEFLFYDQKEILKKDPTLYLE
ncbi:unnamed protein product [Rhizophagus irregularis]|nr:unnamed protein product [Rhizophagus irregularis]